MAVGAVVVVAGLMLSPVGTSAQPFSAIETPGWLAVAQAEPSRPAREPEAMLRNYWQAIADAETLGELGRFNSAARKQAR